MVAKGEQEVHRIIVDSRNRVNPADAEAVADRLPSVGHHVNRSFQNEGQVVVFSFISREGRRAFTDLMNVQINGGIQAVDNEILRRNGL